jgi:hypothetical protein
MEVKIKVYGDPQKIKKRQSLLKKIKSNQKEWSELSQDEKDNFFEFLFEIYKEKIK